MEKAFIEIKNKKERLDKWLSKIYPSLSNRQIEEAIESQLVTGPGGERLKKGELVLAAPNTHLLETHIERLWLGNANLTNVAIVSEGEEYVVIDKPVGLPSHPLGLFDLETVTSWALARYPDIRKEFKAMVQPTLCPHRLDTDTSGLLIVCRNKNSFNSWRRRFQQKVILKTYLAWCWGQPKQDVWIEESPIGHDKKDRTRMIGIVKDQTSHRPPVLEAKTMFRVLKRKKGKFLVQAQMRTGVTHQIRVHLSMAGYPLLGDRKYDLEWSTRSKNPPHHLLRATELRIKNKSEETLIYQDSTSYFSKLY